MPLRSRVAEGVIHPGEMVFLQEIFDDVCRSRRISPNSAAAESLATVLVEAYLEGVRDRDELHELMMNAHASKVG